MNNTELQWQTRDEMDRPTNPLQQLHETMCNQSRDMSEDKMTAFIYGIIVGWDDDSYEELKSQHNWDEQIINRLKMLHDNYQKAWNLFMKNI